MSGSNGTPRSCRTLWSSDPGNGVRIRQRSKDIELEDIERQFLLDDVDVAGNRFRGVAREAEDIAAIGDHPAAPPRLQHLAIFPDLVLPLLGSHQRLRVDILKPDEGEENSRASALLDEISNPVAQRIDLDEQSDLDLFLLPQIDEAIEDRFPVPIAGEIIVRDEET